MKIEFKGKTKLGSLLSHLAYTPFVVDTCYTSSFEGFRQGLRFQADDNNRGAAFGNFGRESRKLALKCVAPTMFSFRGKLYMWGSQEHYDLLVAALRKKLELGTIREELAALPADTEFEFTVPDRKDDVLKNEHYLSVLREYVGKRVPEEVEIEQP